MVDVDSSTGSMPSFAGGRSFTATRRVRWGDTDLEGRLRLDGIARYLQDVANDDTRDGGDNPSAPWVVRRTTIDVRHPPRTGEVVELTTFNGGLGARWAERRTTIIGNEGGHVEAMALWVHVDRETLRPARLPASFVEHYADFTGDRKVGARLRHGPVVEGAERRAWPLRSTDLDALGHVNNAATWEPVEDELHRRGLTAGWAELEYADGIEPGDAVALVSAVDPSGDLLLWLIVDDVVRASGVVRAPGVVRP